MGVGRGTEPIATAAPKAAAFDERLLKLEGIPLPPRPTAGFWRLAKVVSVDLATDPLGAVAAAAGAVS